MTKRKSADQLRKRGPKGPRQTVDLRDFSIVQQIDAVRVATGCSISRAAHLLADTTGPLEMPHQFEGFEMVARIPFPATLAGRRGKLSVASLLRVYHRIRARIRAVR